MLLHNIELPHSRYMEGNTFMQDRWQKVRIPLTDMDASNKIITRLIIKDISGKCQREFQISRIRLVGNVSDVKK